MEASGCRIVEYGKPYAEFSIYDVADLHLLNRGVSKNHLIRDIERIKNDQHALYFIGGDYADWIYPGDKRFDPAAFGTDVMVTDLSQLGAVVAKMMIDYFSPIKRKCLGALIGNHEFTAMNHNSETYIHEYICRQLGIANMRFSGFTDIYFIHTTGFRGCRVSFANTPPKKYTARLRVFLHHGMGAANTAGGKINKLKTLVDMVDADLVMMGHVHEQFAKAFLRMVPNADCSDINQKVTMGMITGSYLKTYAPGFTSYGEIKGYSATTLGATRARYIPHERILTVENRADNVGTRGNK